MPARSRKRQNNRPNAVWIFVAIIIVIAILTMIVTYFYVDDDKPDVLLVPSTDRQEQSNSGESAEKQAAQIEGVWVSNYDGAMLTLHNQSFSLEISGVDINVKAEGSLAIEGNIVTFVITSGTDSCKGVEGHYLYSIEDNGDLFFKLIKDNCDSRQERMTATWFRL